VKTYALKKADIQREWWVVDAEGQTLGRLATQIATLLRGKHKPTFSTHLDNGDFVIVLNAGKIKVTGGKLDDKKYYSYSLYPGGLRTTALRDVLARNPERVITSAVKGMLPDNRMSHHLMGKLKVYKTGTHPHGAQNPKVWPAKEKQA
jgi:large subunit ribosomal protein L13